MNRSPRTRATLSLILLIGLALRLFRLGADSLWYDETVSVLLAGSPLPELIRHTAGDIHPPLYYLLLRGWLIALGYPAGHADPAGHGLEFAAGFFSLFFGLLLIALIYALARRLAGPRAALIAAALAAFSPYNIWYSQEARMYTLGAVLGVVVVLALAHIAHRPSHIAHRTWWAAYAVAAAAGMYTLYYFAFLLIPLNLWALARAKRPSRLPPPTSNPQPPTSNLQPPTSNLRSLLRANLAAALLYAPWLPIAWRQATDPPVPPWRTAPAFVASLMESLNALALGQSAPGWVWPAVLLALAVYALGAAAVRQWSVVSGQLSVVGRRSSVVGRRSSVVGRRSSAVGRQSSAVILPIATFGPLLLILLISLVTPLYHVRYLFTYSPAFYVALGAGGAWLWARRRWAAGLALAAWLAAAAVTLHAFWFDPAYRPDDHRAAVRALQARWRPGDVLLVNAGYAYPPLRVYWQGPIAGRARLTEPLPQPRADAALVIVVTGHLSAALSDASTSRGLRSAELVRLGWGDPRSDFFAMPAADAARQMDALFQTFGRVWHYRIYDTVNDPAGQIRAALTERGYLFEDQLFSGEANMRVQGFMPRAGATWSPDLPAARYRNGLAVQPAPLPATIPAGAAICGGLTWRSDATLATAFGVSLRLVDAAGVTWAQPTDERPFGPAFLPPQWPAGLPQRQPFCVPVLPGTPPGAYAVVLIVYDPETGAAWPPPAAAGQAPAPGGGLALGQMAVARGAAAARPALAQFGPLALIEATSPAAALSPGDAVPVELLWQARRPPGEPLVVVVQLLGAGDALIANLEAQPVGGRYPTTAWTANELVRDRHTLQLPAGLPAGAYRLVVGVYRAADLVRLQTRSGLFGESSYWVVKQLTIR